MRVGDFAIRVVGLHSQEPQGRRAANRPQSFRAVARAFVVTCAIALDFPIQSVIHGVPVGYPNDRGGISGMPGRVPVAARPKIGGPPERVDLAHQARRPSPASTGPSA
jgi:hypothetical protein